MPNMAVAQSKPHEHEGLTAVQGAESRWARVLLLVSSRATSLPVTGLYAVALITVSVTLSRLGSRARDVVVDQMSTNLHNLSHGHLGTLIGSAFVSEGGDVFTWLPGLVCLLALGELLWRSKGLLIAFTVGHVGATLLVAVWLTVAVEAEWQPIAVAHATDVGVSYGAVCVLGALTASIPAPWRTAWIGWWLGTAATAALGANFTAIGHILALLLGIGLSFRLRSVAQWTPMHIGLFTVGVTFAQFVLAGSSVMALFGGLVGILIALFANRDLRLRGGIPPLQPELVSQPAR